MYYTMYSIHVLHVLDVVSTCLLTKLDFFLFCSNLTKKVHKSGVEQRSIIQQGNCVIIS